MNAAMEEGRQRRVISGLRAIFVAVLQSVQLVLAVLVLAASTKKAHSSSEELGRGTGALSEHPLLRS